MMERLHGRYLERVKGYRKEKGHSSRESVLN